MRIVIISDTHGGHEALGTLEGDVLIHCGDLEGRGAAGGAAYRDIDDWFGAQRFEQIFCIGGNHDFDLEQRIRVDDQPFVNATWLHERAITLRGVTFYGTSWVPELRGFAFYADDHVLKAAWARIPNEVDVLVTHTPPKGVLDVSSAGHVLGCPYLARWLEQTAPRVHCFGHVHAAAGYERRGNTTFVNASVVDSRLEVVHPPTIIDLDQPPRDSAPGSDGAPGNDVKRSPERLGRQSGKRSVIRNWLKR
ncbi:MAG: metallophosphatase domain-containing protein [Pseudomonadota bacterium]